MVSAEWLSVAGQPASATEQGSQAQLRCTLASLASSAAAYTTVEVADERYAAGPTFTIHEVEFDPGTIEFAMRRIEAFSVPVLRNGLNRHRTNFYHIIWLTGFMGEGKIWINLDYYPLRPRMMCFVSPGQVRAWEGPAFQTGASSPVTRSPLSRGFLPTLPTMPTR